MCMACTVLTLPAAEFHPRHSPSNLHIPSHHRERLRSCLDVLKGLTVSPLRLRRYATDPPMGSHHNPVLGIASQPFPGRQTIGNGSTLYRPLTLGACKGPKKSANVTENRNKVLFAVRNSIK